MSHFVDELLNNQSWFLGRKSVWPYMAVYWVLFLNSGGDPGSLLARVCIATAKMKFPYFDLFISRKCLVNPIVRQSNSILSIFSKPFFHAQP